MRCQSWRREVRHGQSRFDFEILQHNGRSCLVEVKSVVAIEGSTGRFPDAPSERARRHCEELAQLAQEGQDTAVVLVAQRGDIQRIRPHKVDPAFKLALSRAKSSGVMVFGLSFSVSTHGFHYIGRIPVKGV